MHLYKTIKFVCNRTEQQLLTDTANMRTSSPNYAILWVILAMFIIKSEYWKVTDETFSISIALSPVCECSQQDKTILITIYLMYIFLKYPVVLIAFCAQQQM